MVISMEQATTLADVHAAAERIQGVAQHTPLSYSPHFSQQLGCAIYFKLENLQTTGAFKIRGAYNKIARLTPAERERGLVAASSGNHAQGVAYAAHAFGVDTRTTIFMPESTPTTKIQRTRRFGRVDVQTVPGNFDLAREQAHSFAQDSGATFIEPYNDWDIIAGQGTIGLEIVRDLPDVDQIIVPIGGGGLVSGIALAARETQPGIRVTAVGATYAHPGGYTIADGIRVKQPGEKPRQLIARYVRDIVRVPEDAIVQAVQQIVEQAHVIVEGAGAVGLAALQTGLIPVSDGEKVVVVLSGGNIDMARMADLLGNLA